MIEKLQYITQETEKLTHIDCVREACIAGVRWIQLRVKDKSQEEQLKIAKEAKIICDLYDAKLIINDNVEIAKQVQANGVHLGKADMPISEARAFLGDHFIIGGTANTIQDVAYLINEEVDYIGLGPFRFTNTKKKLSPTLGFEGYEDILHQLKLTYSMDEVPIIAVGGIKQEDIEKLLQLGVYGVAMSNELTSDFTKTKMINELLEKVVVE